jgi:hypothetical protein
MTMRVTAEQRPGADAQERAAHAQRSAAQEEYAMYQYAWHND